MGKDRVRAFHKCSNEQSVPVIIVQSVFPNPTLILCPHYISYSECLVTTRTRIWLSSVQPRRGRHSRLVCSVTVCLLKRSPSAFPILQRLKTGRSEHFRAIYKSLLRMSKSNESTKRVKSYGHYLTNLT